MNKNTMLYGLLIAGGLLAYFVWKKNSEDSENQSQTAPNSNSGTFVDDAPVSQEVADNLLQDTGGIKPPRTESISQITEPLIGTKQQMGLSDKNQSIEP
jgi:hypothetical protein